MKNAQLFSMMAVFMSALFIILFSGLTHVALNKQTEISEAEIIRFSSLAESLDYFVNMALETSGYLFLNSSVDRLEHNCLPTPTSGCFFTNYMDSFNNCLATSYDSQQDWNCSPEGAVDFNMSYKSQLEYLASKIEERYDGVSINISKTHTSVKNTGPYTFELNGQVHVSLTKKGYSWNRFFNITREISIIGMKDPSLAIKNINQTIRVFPVEGELITVASLSGRYEDIAKIVNESYYFRDNVSGLSIVEQFQGVKLENLTSESHPFGINSVIKPLYPQPYRNQTSLLEQHYVSELYLPVGQRLYRFDPDKFYGVDDDIIVHEDFFLRLGITDFKRVGNCCNDDGCIDTC